MKLKMLSLFLMVMFAFSAAQPIFATLQVGDTLISDKKLKPLSDITVLPGKEIKLQARLYKVEDFTNNTFHCLPQRLRYLYFSVYKLNNDGTNGPLVWSARALTNVFTYNANPHKFVLAYKGDYRLVVEYKGKLKHCNATATIRVV